jgi:hypothetical protein
MVVSLALISSIVATSALKKRKSISTISELKKWSGHLKK